MSAERADEAVLVLMRSFDFPTVEAAKRVARLQKHHKRWATDAEVELCASAHGASPALVAMIATGREWPRPEYRRGVSYQLPAARALFVLLGGPWARY
ncbi:MAG: hypothetical protein O9284_09375 [Steroidobacteraceae bacterium]|nr:hypothetical protein [Steroidobacteraceae bacterium]